MEEKKQFINCHNLVVERQKSGSQDLSENPTRKQDIELEIVDEDYYDNLDFVKQLDFQKIYNERSDYHEFQKEHFKDDIEKLKEFQLKRHKISIAPMLAVTNPQWRFAFRLVCREATLYTEMIHANAVIHQINDQTIKGEVLRMGLAPIEHPVVFQLGGSEPKLLAEASKLIEKLGYDEINLNCGCPSQKVQSGSFGACLMSEPELVGECMKQVGEVVSIPYTVKHRIGVDDCDDFEFMKKFVVDVNKISGVTHFQAHARKAYLKGLDPSQNRNIPPLKYENVIRLKKELPQFDISINGGFKSYESVKEVLKEDNKLAGCMIGRWAQECIWNLNDVDRQFYGVPNPTYSRREILMIYVQYAEWYLAQNPDYSWNLLKMPILNLFNGERNNNIFKRVMSLQVKSQKTFKSFKHMVVCAMKNFEKYNKTALDQRPPTNDDEYIAQFYGTKENYEKKMEIFREQLQKKKEEKEADVQEVIQSILNQNKKKAKYDAKLAKKREEKAKRKSLKKEMQNKEQNGEQQNNEQDKENDKENQELSVSKQQKLNNDNQ